MKTRLFALFFFAAFVILSGCTKNESTPAAPVGTANPKSQTIASGATTNIALSSDISGTTFSWTVIETGVTGAMAGSGASIAQTLTASGTSIGTVTYTITPSADGVKGTNISVVVTVNPIPKPIATAAPSEQTIISGETTSIALTSNISGTTFTWTVEQTGVTRAIAGSGASIAQSLTASGTTTGTAKYTITPMAGGVNGTAITVTITVNPVVVQKTTFVADIKPLLLNSCKPCHTTGSQAKFDNYTTVKSKITGIIDRVQRNSTASGFMPQGGPKMSDADIALLKKWVADGHLEN